MMNVISPGYFGNSVAADSRRGEFDYKNESLLRAKTKIDYLFIGDSITHYWEVSDYFDMTRSTFINRGIGGDVTNYLSKHLTLKRNA